MGENTEERGSLVLVIATYLVLLTSGAEAEAGAQKPDDLAPVPREPLGGRGEGDQHHPVQSEAVQQPVHRVQAAQPRAGTGV